MANLLGRLARRLTRGPQGPQRADAARRTVLPDAPAPDAAPPRTPVAPAAVPVHEALLDAPPAAAPSPIPVLEPASEVRAAQTLLPAAIVPAPTSAPTPSGPRVFISHSTLDNEFGRRLAADLRQALGGAEDTVWFEASGGLQGGDVWLDQIAAELTSRDVFLLILSPAALSSAWVQDELHMAWKQRNAPGPDGVGKVIIPVLYQSCAVPEYLATIQYVSFLPPRSYSDSFAEVLAAVRAGTTRVVPLARQATTILGPPNDVALLPSPQHFVGRADDLAWVVARLRVGGAVATTALRGLGGIGKTALAGVAVRLLQQETRFPAGIAVVLCQGLTDPAEVLRRILIRFDPLRRAPEATELSQLQDLAQVTLRGKQALVVLDNVEPELPVASVVAPLRETGVTLLLTARQTLSQGVVPAEASRALDLLSADEALDLFAGALGRSGVSAFTPAEHTAAEQIVTTLGRHTLAVKLAGAYAAAERRDLGALARELTQPAEGLALPGDDETPEAVRRSFTLSLDSLPLDAQRLFAGLAAFATPGCGRQAALALGANLGQERPERSIHLLVVRALIEPTTSDTLPDDSDRERLRLHPLLRALAELLFRQWSPAQQDAAAQAVAHYFAVSAEDHQDDVAVLAADEGNMVGALEWAHTHGQAPLVADLAHGLRQLWLRRGPYQEGARLLEWGVAAAEAGLAAEETRAARQHLAELRLAYGLLLLYSGQTKVGEAALRLSLDDFRATQNRRGEGEALSALAEASAPYDTQFEIQEALYQQSLAIAQQVGDQRTEGTALAGLGFVAWSRGQFDTADTLTQRSLAIFRAIGDRPDEGMALHTLAQAAVWRGQFEAAEAYSQEGLALARELDSRGGMAGALFPLAVVALRRGQYQTAETYLQEQLELAREIGNRAGEGGALTFLGYVALRRGQYERAQTCLQEALAIARETGVRRDESVAVGMLGEVAERRGQFEAAEASLQESLVLAREVDDFIWIVRCLCSLGRVAGAVGDLLRAEPYYRDSLALATERNMGPEIAEAQLALGRLLAERLDRRAEGCTLLIEAAQRFAEMGMPEAAEAREAAEQLGCGHETP